MTPVTVHDSQLPPTVSATLAKLAALGISAAGEDHSVPSATLTAAGVSLDDLREAVRAHVAVLESADGTVLRQQAAVIERLLEEEHTTTIRLGVDVSA